MPTQIDLIAGLRGRWRLVAAVVAVSMLAGFAVIVIGGKHRHQHPFSAVATLVGATDINQRQGRSSSLPSLGQFVSVVQTSDVATRAATILKSKTDVVTLLKQVTSASDPKAGSLTITAQAPDSQGAIDTANAFATATIALLQDQNSAQFKAALDAQSRALRQLQAEISALNKKLGPAKPGNQSPYDIRRTQLDAKVRDYTAQFQQYQDLKSRGPDSPPLRISGLASSAAVVKEAGGIIRAGRKLKMVIAIFVGLLFGLAVAVVTERIDPRVRTRKQAQSSFGLPVLAAVPLLPWAVYWHRVAVHDEPRSKYAAIFRLLRASVTHGPQERTNGDVRLNGDRIAPPPRVIVVTSPGDASAKTTVSANIAAILAEAGNRVALVSTDMRRPNLHRMLEVPAEPGFLQLVAKFQIEISSLSGSPHRSNGGSDRAVGSPISVLESDGIGKSEALHPTLIKNLVAVPSGGKVDDPGPVLASVECLHVISWLRTQHDVIVVDTSSLLDESEGTPLISIADSILVVSRAGRTTIEGAQRAGEFLKRMNAPVAGVVHVGPKRIWRFKAFRIVLFEKAARLPRPHRHKESVPDVQAELELDLAPIETAKAES